MKALIPIVAGLFLGAALFAQDDPFAGGEDTAVAAPASAANPADSAAPGGAGDPAAPIAPPPPADPAVAGDSMVFHEDLKQFEFDVTVNAYKAVNETLDAQSFAAKNKARGAINPPVLTPQQVEAAIEQEVERRIQIEYPDSRFEEIKREAEEDFKMWKVGDRIKVMARRGDKMVPFVGPLEFVTRTRIKISSYPIFKDDIGKDYLPRLYRVDHERAVQRQVSRETRIFNEKRDEYGTAQRSELTPQLWYAAGYIRGGKDNWVPRQKVFAYHYEKARKKAYEREFKANREKVYLDNGWVFDPTLNRWLSPADQLPPEPVAAATDGTPEGQPDEAKPTAGGIFDTIQNLLNKNGAPPAAEPGGEADVWDDEPKKEKAAPAGAAAGAEAAPAKSPGDDSDLFGDE